MARLNEKQLLKQTDKGIYCEQGGFYIDPWKPVSKAIVTHAHSDHSRPGHEHYLAHVDSAPVMKQRLGRDIDLQLLKYGEEINISGVNVSLHPAGHTIGSAQVRVEYKGRVEVVTGDYKLNDDGIATAFIPVKCDLIITEATFALPVYKWRPQAEVIAEINQWWRSNAEKGVTSILTCYAFGKAQRILHNVDKTISPILVHGAIYNTNEALRQYGIDLPEAKKTLLENKNEFPGALVLAPMSALGTTWVRRFRKRSIASASGWMQLRGIRRRQSLDRGFVLSDHADWVGLNQAIAESDAQEVLVTHGYKDVFSRWLNEKGLKSAPLETEFNVEEGE